MAAKIDFILFKAKDIAGSQTELGIVTIINDNSGARNRGEPYAFNDYVYVNEDNEIEISLVGFDGYSADDPRQEEMNDVFFKYTSHEKSVSISTLTPTTYRIKQSSIFAPIIS